MNPSLCRVASDANFHRGWTHDKRKENRYREHNDKGKVGYKRIAYETYTHINWILLVIC